MVWVGEAWTPRDSCAPSSDACIGCCSSSRARGHPESGMETHCRKMASKQKGDPSHRCRSSPSPWRLARQCGALQKHIKVKGKWRWQLEKYVRIATHKVPGTKTVLKVKAGTQVIDRAWRYLNDRIVLNQNCTAGLKRLRSKLRSAQYLCWYRQKDLCVACALGK